jgi:glutamate N-acetyltransferase / amino-acid N-acetyltransferase
VSTCSRWQGSDIRALLINSGNANAATGEPGLADAAPDLCRVAEALDIDG